MIHFEDNAEVIAEQGWNEDTMLFMCSTFITQNGLNDKFADFLREMAEQENAQSEESE